MKRFIVISDLHAHPWSAFASGDGAENSRLRQTLTVLRASLQEAQDLDIPWLFPGDLVHTAGYSLNVVMAGLIEVFQGFQDVPKVVCWGNHDARGVGGEIQLGQTVFPALIQALDNLHLVDPSAPETSWEYQGLRIGGAGYQPRADLLDPGPGGDIGLFHQTVRGSVTATGFELPEGIERSVLLDHYRVSLVGHVHHPQQIEAPPGQAILVPGSPEHHNFGDHGEHGWWLLTLPDDSKEDPVVEFREGGSPHFLTVETSEEVQDDANFYRVRKSTAGDELPDNSTAIRPEPTTVKSRDLLRGVAEIEQILQVWVRENPPEGDITDHLTVGRQLLEAQDPAPLRPARLDRIRLQNFGSYADETLPVEPGLFLVTGDGRDYPSNGAGKTTLVGEAAYYLIHGKTTKGQGADEVVRWGESEMVVEGWLMDPDSGAELLHIRRGRKGGSPFMEVHAEAGPWEASGVTEMTQKLQRWLGLTPEIHQAVGYVSQEKVLYFAAATDGERKNILADLAGLSAYQRASSAAGESGSATDKELQQLRARMEAQTEQLEEARETVESTKSWVTEWEVKQTRALEEARVVLREYQQQAESVDLEARMKEIRARSDALLEQRLTEIRAEFPKRKQAYVNAAVMRGATHRNNLQGETDELVQKLTTRWGSLDSIRGLVQNLPQLRDVQTRAEEDQQSAQRAASEQQAEVGRLRGRLEGDRKAILRARSELEHAEQQFADGVCPTCEQEVSEQHLSDCLQPFRDRLQDQEKAVAEMEELLNKAVALVGVKQTEVEEAQKRAQTVRERIADIEQAQGDVSRLKQLEEALAESLEALDALKADAVTRAREELNREEERIEQHRAGWVRRAERVATRLIKEMEQKFQSAEEHIKELEDQENPLQPRLIAAEKKMQELTDRLDSLTTRIQELATKRDVYEYWSKGFSKQGIQSLLLEEIATLFNEHRGDIFPLLTEGKYDVQFSTLSQTRAGALREKTDFIVYYRGKEIPYASLSGGQRRRVDLGIMVTLARAVAEWMQVPGILGMICLDEVFGFLDASGAEGLLSVLQEVQETIPTIYAVTHDPALQSLFPEVIHITQDSDGISRVAR